MAQNRLFRFIEPSYSGPYAKTVSDFPGEVRNLLQFKLFPALLQERLQLLLVEMAVLIFGEK